LSMQPPLVLASASAIRAHLLAQAGLLVTVRPARIDEDALRSALAARGVAPRDMADALAEAKARKVRPGASRTAVMQRGHSWPTFAVTGTRFIPRSCYITTRNRCGGRWGRCG